jgi:hypothetical protein
MRKWFFVLTLALALAWPSLTQAQAAVTMDTLTVQLWPEYDQPKVLVIYDFKVSADTALPAQVTVRIPAGAELLAVAYDQNGGLLNADYQGPTRDGDWDVLTLTVASQTVYHVEYYYPFEKNGAARRFVYLWPGDYAVKEFRVKLQEPAGATNVQTDPVLPAIAPESDGLIYHSTLINDLGVGEQFTLKVNYDKPDDSLSASALDVRPTGNLDSNTTGRTALTTYLPWILGGLGFVLLAGGVFWYWQSGRESGGQRKRHASRRAVVEEEEEDQDDLVYCPQCGKRAQSDDRFCRACGTRIRHGEG